MEADVQPFIGPRPFTREDRQRYFGRGREVVDLATLVIAHPIVFLYGQSGTGKTSLLHAGIIPKLATEEGFVVLPVVRPGGVADQYGAEQSTASPYVYATLRTWAGAVGDPAPPTDTNLSEYLARLTPVRDEEGDPRPRLLVFDQLEEIFHDQIDVYQEQHEFFTQIGELLQRARGTGGREGERGPGDAVPTRVLLSMREEYIAQLDDFAMLLPERLRTRYRLERLRAPAALEAITGPVSLTSLAFLPGVAEQLVADLREVRVEAGVGEARRAVNVLGEFVEPVQLQVVCERLVRLLPEEAVEITFEHLSTFGSVDATLSAFYQDAVRFAAQQSSVPQEQLERWCETHLITETGTRAVVHRGPTHSYGVPNSAPDALVERLLVRKEPRAGAEWYELTHDRLIGPIQAARLSRERREASEREVAEVKRRLAAERRVRLLVAGLVIAAVGAYLLTSLYFGSRRPPCIGTLTCDWQFRTGGEVFGQPTIGGSIAYIPSTDGHVYAIDTSQPERLFASIRNGASRQLLWNFQTGDQVWGSPALSHDTLYVGSADKKLYALDAATGREVDTTAASAPVFGSAAAAAAVRPWPFETGGPIVTSPFIAEGVIYFGSFDQNLYAVEVETGRELWRFPTGDAVVSSPAVSSGVVYVGSNDDVVYAVDTRSGKARWRFETAGDVRSSPAVVDGVVYIGSFDSNLYAIDADTGKERWRFKTGERIRSSPAVDNGAVYVGSYDQNVYALDASTGAVIWQFRTGGWVVSSPLVQDGVVYVGSNDGRFYALDAASGAKLAELTADGIVQSFPAALDGSILFGSSGGSVYAIDQVRRTAEAQSTPVVLATPRATPFATP